MKKFLILSLVVIISLAACGKKDADTNPENGDGSPITDVRQNPNEGENENGENEQEATVLSGLYTAESLGQTISLEFLGDGAFRRIVLIDGETTPQVSEYTYEIEDDNFKISYTVDGEVQTDPFKFTFENDTLTLIKYYYGQDLAFVKE